MALLSTVFFTFRKNEPRKSRFTPAWTYLRVPFEQFSLFFCSFSALLVSDITRFLFF